MVNEIGNFVDTIPPAYHTEGLTPSQGLHILINLDENGESPIDVIGLQAPFTITGDQRLIKLGYECGFGEKNSMGFGMADTDFTD